MAPKKSQGRSMKGGSSSGPGQRAAAAGRGVRSAGSQVESGRGDSRGGNARTAAKSTSVSLSVENEARLRGVLETAGSLMKESDDRGGSGGGTHHYSKKQTSKKLQNIYDSLLGEGFKRDEVERALQALPVASTTFESALDWLCLNLPSENLPIKFSTGVRTRANEGGSVQVVKSSKVVGRPEDSVQEWEREGPTFPSGADIISHEGRLVDSEALVKKGKKGEKFSWNEQADLIRRYLEQQEEEEESDNDEKGSGSEDDWEVWADPREQMRRKQERKKVDPAHRAISAAAEYRAAKEEAMKAKEKGDKLKQMAAGKIIKELKEEMARLGLEEEVLYREPTGNVAVVDDSYNFGCREFGEGGANEGSSFVSLGLLQVKEECAEEESIPKRFGMAEADESQEAGDELSGHDASRDEGVSGGLVIAEVGEAKAVAEQEEDAEEEGMGLMFNEEVALEEWPASVVMMKRKEKKVIEMWGTGSQGGGKQGSAGRKGKGKAPSQEELFRMPKTVLQQLCQKNGWLSPRYDKLPLLESGAWGQYRYSVTVLRPSGGRQKGRVLIGPATYQLAEDEDGWESVSDAQNAVATRALYSLVENQPMYRTLPSPYREMWLRWDEQGAGKLKEETAEEQARRSAFINTLISTGSSAPKVKTEEPRSKEGEAETSPLIAGTTQPEEWEEMAALIGIDKRNSKMEDERLTAESRVLKEKRRHLTKSSKYKAMDEVRSSLPILTVKDEMLHALQEWGVLVVSGETGSGKTTQVPQYILDDMLEREEGAICNIICTQPRRIAAVSVAERVAEERCEPPPGSPEATVGYHVRLDAARSRNTRLLFCTTGILLRRFASDPDLAEVTHVIVDEVHERTIQGDFLLIILKDLLERRKKSPNLPQLRLVLMSATVDPSLFSGYFGGCPIISASGRTFGVDVHFLENVYEILEYRLTSSSEAALHGQHNTSQKKTAKNLVASSRGRQDLVRSGWGDDTSLDEAMVNSNYDEKRYFNYSERTRKNLALVDEDKIDYDLLEELIIHIDANYEPGAILVFLPGVAEIQAVLDRLTVSARFGVAGCGWVLPLHSLVSPSEQKRVFMRPPENIRKIVIATNIAETSITIDDIVYVVDSGKHKENRFNPRRGMTCLVEAWISRANAKQRQGRAGRVREGHYFALYTKHRHSQLMRMYQLPEMLRVSLVELCLQIMVLNLGSVSSFLAKAIEPPKDEAIASAMQVLQEIGATDEKKELTSLGYHLAAMPVDVHIGKVMLYGTIFGCLMPALTIAACLSYRSPFTLPRHKEKHEAEQAWQALVAPNSTTQESGEQSIARGEQSDHLAMVAAYEGWRSSFQKGGPRAAREYCRKTFLSFQTLEMIRDMRKQFATLLADIGFVKPPQGSAIKDKWSQDWVDDPKQQWNVHALHPSLIKAVLCAGLYPNIAAMTEESILLGHASPIGGGSGARPKWTDGERQVAIHPSSLNHPLSNFKFPFMVYHEKVQTTRVFVRDCSVVSPYQLLLFGGPITVHHQTGRVTVDGWLSLKAPAQIAVLFKELRRALDALLAQKISRPKTQTTSSVNQEVINTIAKLLIDEQKS